MGAERRGRATQGSLDSQPHEWEELGNETTAMFGPRVVGAR